MNILILGSGGREHALAWKISKSPKINKLFVAPGNAGTSKIAQNISLDPNDFKSVKKIIIDNNINYLIVGAEEQLVNGIHDYLLNCKDLKNLKIIGTKKEGAKLEGSKEFSKKFMNKYNIPTAKYSAFDKENFEKGVEFLEKLKAPYVLKADGLAGGKGVLIIDNIEEAKTSLKEMLNGKFGKASEKVVIEEFLDGIEVSVFILTDGKNYKILPEAKDYKRIGEKDTGLNTGGMGAISPVDFVDENFLRKIEEKIIKRTINGLQKEKIEYQGFLFFGLINVKNEPYVIEYNVRMGDPETEVIMPRIKSDLMDLLEGVANKNLNEKFLEFEKSVVSTVILVSEGYPLSYEKGKEIKGFENVKDSIIFHSGTKIENGKIISNGGRVLAITSFGKDKNEALKKSYKNSEIIKFENKFYRKDIGFDI